MTSQGQDRIICEVALSQVKAPYEWVAVGGEAPELLELPTDDEQALLAGRLATFASDEVTERTQAYWNAFFGYLATGPALVQDIEATKPDEELTPLRHAEASAFESFRGASVALRSAVRADLTQP